MSVGPVRRCGRCCSCRRRNPRAIAKARESEADLVVLDLEDAVKPEDKEAARAGGGRGGRVELGRCRSRSGSTASGPNGIRSTSTPSPASKCRLGRSSAGRRRRNWSETSAKPIGKPVLAMIETAAGVLAAPTIAHEAAALIAGTNDLARRPAPAAGCGAGADLRRRCRSIVLAGARARASRRSTACSTGSTIVEGFVARSAGRAAARASTASR